MSTTSVNQGQSSLQLSSNVPSIAGTLRSANELLAAHTNLIERVRGSQIDRRRKLKALEYLPEKLRNLPLIRSPHVSPSPSPPLSPASTSTTIDTRPIRTDLPPSKRARVARYENYIPEEETIRNDYSQRYVDGGELPQNWVLGAEPEHRFEEYPKQQRLLALKKAAVADAALPSTYLELSQLSDVIPLKFDVILIDPPFSTSFNWDDLEKLPVPALASDPSFVFLWVGSSAGEGLERGREILGKWGYRRCEDVVWVKTNKDSNLGPGTDPPTTSLFTRTKQHCLMGIRGTVRRSTDSWFAHCNIDTDVIIWEGDPLDPTRKPPEMYTLIENFCLGTRRLEIFGRIHSLRRGWVTAMSEEVILTPEQAKEHDNAVPFDKEAWDARLKELAHGSKCVVPNTPEIELLRPKSPVPRINQNVQSNSNVGLNSRHFDTMKGMTPNAQYNVLPFAPPMNMIGVGMNTMGNTGQVGWQMNPMAMAQAMPMQAQPGFGYHYDNGQAMMDMNTAMSMGMNPGFVFGFNGGQPNMGFGQGDGGMWVGDSMNNQMQFLDTSLWDGSGNNGIHMNQWGFGGYQ